MTQFEEYLFGIPLSTHRNRTTSSHPFGEFHHELVIAAVSVVMFRTTVRVSSNEPMMLRWFFGILLGFLAYSDKSYELIVAVELFSYVVPICLLSDWPLSPWKNYIKPQYNNFVRLSLVFVSAGLSMALSHVFATGAFSRWLAFVTPTQISNAVASLLPIKEVRSAYDILDRFVSEPGLLDHQIRRLLFVTFHVQCGMGYMGIDFLKEEQNRRNELVRMDVTGEEKSDDTNVTPGTSSEADQKTTGYRLNKARNFQKTAGTFILYSAVPYMIRIIAYGNLNAFAFSCFKDDIHRMVRLDGLFEHESHLVAVAEHSATSPEGYAGYMDTIVDTTYGLFNRKFFSLPKVMLLPMVMTRQPQMMAQIFPIIFFTDWAKGRAVSYMTSRIEALQKETQELSSMRSKVEAFDIKSAELLQRAGPGATDFTRRRWEDLTVQVQMKNVAKELTSRTKDFFAFIQRNFVFTVLVDCALARLIAIGKLVAADVFVFSRAIEDAVDMVLMKSRSEAELARMMTQIEKMEELASVWDKAKTRNLISCKLPSTLTTNPNTETQGSMLILENIKYSRGTAMVRVDRLELEAGVYALTGANGSGKSTLFRVLMSCDTNERSIDLPSSIKVSTFHGFNKDNDTSESEAVEESIITPEGEVIPSVDGTGPRMSITMPSAHIVEISQTFYWPLYTKPIDWIHQEHLTDTRSPEEVERMVRKVAEELQSMEFAQSLGTSSSSTKSKDPLTDNEIIVGIMGELVMEKEDWFSNLSGGQRSKVELTRTVFLKDRCPDVLLVDETMAPLDPRSKALVMAKLKNFCSGSVVLVIYHTDVGRELEGDEGEVIECVPSNDFFDANIHVENKQIHLRPVC